MAGQEVEINPQPLPPGFETFIEAIATGVMRAVDSRELAASKLTGGGIKPPKLPGRLICGIIWDERLEL